jgi:nicotinate phosphoribosyltransferase
MKSRFFAFFEEEKNMTTAIPDYENLPAAKGYASFVKSIGPLMCDLYALTMTQAAWKLGFADTKKSVSHVFCRTLTGNGQKDAEGKPVKVPYLVNSGLGLAAEWFDGWKYGDDDLRYLATIRLPSADPAAKGARLFSDEFLFWLSQQKITLDIDAMPEGELIFPHEPSLRISGLFWQQQVVEGALLHLISSSTNLATVASQVRLFTQREATAENAALVAASARDAPALEKAGLADMSLRRSPGIAALQSARAAFTAGWDSTSNVYAGKCYGIPAMGTFAHAWVMLHDTEEQAFENWAKAYPNTTIFLADTYNTIEGIKNAIAICKKHGLKLKGIRLDSGDAAWLSREATRLATESGFDNVRIFATDKIDRPAARALYADAKKEVGNPSSTVTDFGIGSEISANLYHPLLDEVMKLAALYDGDAQDLTKAVLKDVAKLSETNSKTTLPGALDVVRYLEPGANGETRYAGDTIVPLAMEIGDKALSREIISVDATTGNTKTPFPEGTPFYRPLQPWMRRGEMVQQPYIDRDAAAILRDARARHAASMAHLDPSHKRFEKPHLYGFGIEQSLLARRDAMADGIRLAAKRREQKRRFGLETLVA